MGGSRAPISGSRTVEGSVGEQAFELVREVFREDLASGRSQLVD
jgi:hypothetical protein